MRAGAFTFLELPDLCYELKGYEFSGKFPACEAAVIAERAKATLVEPSKDTYYEDGEWIVSHFPGEGKGILFARFPDDC
jgi:hypothetical protein